MEKINSSSPKVRELIRVANIFALPKQNKLPEKSTKRLESANKSKRLLSRKELNILCKNSHCKAEKLEEIQILSNLAFLTYLTFHINALILKLQNRKQNISQLYGHIEGFHKKIM